MRRLSSIASSISVMTASSPLRSHDARAGQEQVLRELLRDRRAAGDDAAALLVLLERELDAVPVEAFVLDEFRILGGDHRALQRRRRCARTARTGSAAAPADSCAAQLLHPLRHERRSRAADGRATRRSSPRNTGAAATTRAAAQTTGRRAPTPRGPRTRRRVTDRHSLCSSSPLANVHVRVMLRMSVSRRMSSGNGAYGPAISTIFTAAASRIRWPDLRLTSTLLDAAVGADRTRSGSGCRRASSGAPPPDS